MVEMSLSYPNINETRKVTKNPMNSTNQARMVIEMLRRVLCRLLTLVERESNFLRRFIDSLWSLNRKKGSQYEEWELF